MPSAQQQTVITEDGARLAAYVTSPPNATPLTPTVVLAHGWTLDHRSWSRVIDELPDNLRVVLWDQRGHGRSTLRAGRMRTGRESIRQLGEDLAAIIEALVPTESPIVLAGHSMGGMTIMAYAGQQPEFLLRRVRGVVLASTASDGLRGPGIPGERLAMKVLSKIPLRLGWVVTAGMMRGGFGRNPRQADLEHARTQLAGTRLSTIGTFYFALMDHNETGSLQALDAVPVSVLVGSKDTLSPLRYAQSLVDNLPHSRLTELPERGHMLPYEDVDTVVAAIAAALQGCALGHETEIEHPFAQHAS
ncbi:alpha/beta fold hydrolase [Leekyejoonella antrihumi]|uniref:Alpha/beta hydrolase n=1 Tax=Leekyejoonella antrihumi TaxID=1660198 RepID=A0A563E9T3_9MICO|nr:alpha/beta hydrolase [Leekyejoonella antrihumi]TWP39012.1 alpha/beta hydrolase [Leekyejoonella antrihumi]